VRLDGIHDRLTWAAAGGVLGGLIALVGYFIFLPETESLALFLLLRVFVGAVVASVVGPLLAKAKMK
jgi:multisubunit Na+/H+ antiporter MnhG subunit